MKTDSIGTNADVAAGVDISKVHGGYFADQKHVDEFVKIGIVPIIGNFQKLVRCADFGGGQGHLSKGVKDYLEHAGFKAEVLVADANEKYLNLANESGLDTRLCNLEDCNFSNLDLIIMRAVLHYNIPVNQRRILENIFKSLKPGGYLVHQNSSGNKENCELRYLVP